MSESSDDLMAREILRAAGSIDRPTPVSDVLIAAWAEGRLDPERAAIVEAHLAADDEARALAFALRDEATASTAATPPHPIPSLAAARARRTTWVPFAAAAAVLAALGALVLSSGPRTGPTGPGPGDSDARLVAAAADLARTDPAAFGDFHPVGAAERRETVGDATRSGLTILEPVGHVLPTRPGLRWTSAVGATAYDVVVADAGGAVVWRTSTNRAEVASAEAPRLEPGRAYVLEVSATGPLGRTTAGRPFDVADDKARDAFEGALAALARTLGADLGDLARAHLAARRGFLLEAKAAVDAHLTRQPNDAAARDFDAYVRRRLGWPAGR